MLRVLISLSENKLFVCLLLAAIVYSNRHVYFMIVKVEKVELPWQVVMHTLSIAISVLSVSP